MLGTAMTGAHGAVGSYMPHVGALLRKIFLRAARSAHPEHVGALVGYRGKGPRYTRHRAECTEGNRTPHDKLAEVELVRPLTPRERRIEQASASANLPVVEEMFSRHSTWFTRTWLVTLILSVGSLLGCDRPLNSCATSNRYSARGVLSMEGT